MTPLRQLVRLRRRPGASAGRSSLVGALCWVLAACGAPRRAGDRVPAASFLVSAGDSTFWVESDSSGLRVRRSPMLLTEHDGRFYELYLTDFDRSYYDAVILGQQVWRRDVASGDSLLILDDSLLTSVADDYAARHPDEEPLDPDEEASDDPSTHATTDLELIDAAGPFVTIEQHVDIDIAGVRDHHLTRRGVLDLRDGHMVRVADLVGDAGARDVFREGHRLLAVAIDSIRRTRDERARRAATALTGFVFDSLSFALVDQDGAPAVAFSVPGRGVRAGGYALPLPPIPIVAGPWWAPIRTGLPAESAAPGRGLLWRGAGYDIVSRDDSAGDGATIAVRVAPNEWPVAGVPMPVRRIHRLDRPAPGDATLAALRRAFEESAMYSGEVRTASNRAPAPATTISIRHVPLDARAPTSVLACRAANPATRHAARATCRARVVPGDRNDEEILDR